MDSLEKLCESGTGILQEQWLFLASITRCFGISHKNYDEETEKGLVHLEYRTYCIHCPKQVAAMPYNSQSSSSPLITYICCPD